MQIGALMIFTIRLSKNDSEASKSILQISDIKGCNRVKRSFYRNGSKISL